MQALVRAGVDALELRTDDDLLEALVRFCELRRRRLQTQGSVRPGAFAPASTLRPAA